MNYRRFYHAVTIPLYILGVGVAWLGRQPLGVWLQRYAGWWAAAAAFGSVFVALLAAIEWDYHRGLRNAWRERARHQMQWPLSRAPRWFLRLARQGFRFIEANLAPLFETRVGRWLWAYWQDAGFSPVYVVALASWLGTLGLGYLVGWVLTHRVILALFFAFLAWAGLAALTGYLAIRKRNLFREQLPDVVDRLADALQAGFSLSQAIEFVARGLSEPSASEMARVSRSVALGLSVDQALAELARRRPNNESLAFLVEGLALQRYVGGNQVLLLREIASSLREQVRLENEVRTLTTQGRLSAMVIALLVPISLGILSFFPGYVDVLFDTLVGNLVLVVVGLLELLGAVLIWRIIKVDF